MPETRVEKGLFVLGVLAIFALGFVVAHLWQHTHRAAVPSTTSPSPPTHTAATTQRTATFAATTDTASVIRIRTTPQAQTHTRPAKSPPPAAQGTSLLLTARTDTWIEIRTGSATGPVLYSGTLTASATKTFHARSLWARFGAAGNISARLDGKPIGLPAGTYDATFDGHGFRRLGT